MTATIGDNGGPPLDPFTAIQADILDLYELAQGALTGDPITSQEQADQLDELADKCLKAEQAAEAGRKEEKKPHDEAAKAVQTKWKPLVDKAVLAKETARKALTPWKLALEAERQAKIAEQARIAQETAEAAAKAIAAANAGHDLAARERAEELVEVASLAEKQASRAAKPVATGLRTYWDAEITDRRAALNHYVKADPQAFVELIQTLANQDARAGVRKVPGVLFHERKQAA